MTAAPALLQVLAQRCASCNEPGPVLCRTCRFSLAATPRVDVHGIDAALAFDGVARRVVLALKYRNRRAAAHHLAVHAATRLGLGGPGAHRSARRFDVVTWAPTSAGRRHERGFDQAELLAREIARHIGVPCRRLLHRTHGPAQTGRSRLDRLAGPVFRCRPLRRGLRVLVVDDVVTTGATLRSAAAALEAAGAGAVHLVAVAGTPDVAAPRRHLALAS